MQALAADDWDAEGKLALSQEAGEAPARTFSGVRLVEGREAGRPGTLCLTTRRLVWLAEGAQRQGRAVPFRSITLHAVGSEAGQPCIFMQLDTGAGAEEDAREGGHEEEEEGDEEELSDAAAAGEVKLLPADPTQVEEIFQAMCEIAAQNPDPGMDEDDGEGDFYYDEEEIMAGAGGEERLAQLQHLDGMLQTPEEEMEALDIHDDDSRYEDADEEEEEVAEAGAGGPGGAAAGRGPGGGAPHPNGHPPGTRH